MQILSEGQRLHHPQYGLGVVRESDAERTTIDFDEYGEKKFVTSLMTAELIGEPPAPGSRNRAQRRRASKTTARRKVRSQTTPTND